ncbi:MAG: hypothetical protein AB7W16_21305 [Candidatus Obscuribacterales bacterium]
MDRRVVEEARRKREQNALGADLNSYSSRRQQLKGIWMDQLRHRHKSMTYRLVNESRGLTGEFDRQTPRYEAVR